MLWGVEATHFIFACCIFGFILILPVLVNYITKFIRRQTILTPWLWDDDLARLVPAPLTALCQVALAEGVVVLLELPSNVNVIVASVLHVLLGITLVWLGSRLVDVLTKQFARPAATRFMRQDRFSPFFSKLMKALIMGMMLALALQFAGFEVTALITGLGIFGLAVGLAAQDLLNNLLGGALIYADRPFQLGDHIEAMGIEGVVEDIGVRTSRIRMFDNTLVTMPNGTLANSAVKNRFRTGTYPIQASAQVPLSDPTKTAALLQDLRASISAIPDLVPKDPEQAVFLSKVIDAKTALIEINVFYARGPVVSPLVTQAAATAPAEATSDKGKNEAVITPGSGSGSGGAAGENGPQGYLPLTTNRSNAAVNSGGGAFGVRKRVKEYTRPEYLDRDSSPQFPLWGDLEHEVEISADFSFYPGFLKTREQVILAVGAALKKQGL